MLSHQVTGYSDKELPFVGVFCWVEHIVEISLKGSRLRGMSFLPPDYKTPETCPSHDYKPKVLELIARTLGDEFSGDIIISLLKSAGVPDSEIDDKGTKWETILSTFNYAVNENNKAQINIERIIEEFLNPLNHNADEGKAKILAEKIGKFIKYDNLILRQFDAGLVICNQKEYDAYLDQKREEAFNDPESQDQQGWIEDDLAQRIQKSTRELKKRLEDEKTIVKNKEKILDLREFHQAYMDIVEIFCQDVEKPTKKLNDDYIFLSDRMSAIVDGLKLKYYKLELYRPFKNDLYSAEIEWNGDGTINSFKIGPKLSWDAIRPNLYRAHSRIIRMYNLSEQGAVVTDDKSKLKQINDLISQTRAPKASVEEGSISPKKYSDVKESIEIKTLGIKISGNYISKGDNKSRINSTDRWIIYFLYYKFVNHSDECFEIVRLVKEMEPEMGKKTKSYIKNRISKINKAIRELVIKSKTSVGNFIKNELPRKGYHLNPQFLIQITNKS